MNLRQIVISSNALIFAAILSTSALAAGRGGGHGGGHSGGGHAGHGHSGGGHGHAGHHGGGHHRHGGGGRFASSAFTGPTFGWYYPGPSRYYASHVGLLVAPAVYLEQGGESNAVLEADWYYCAESKTYYPYVKQCPREWQRVPAQPPPNP